MGGRLDCLSDLGDEVCDGLPGGLNLWRSFSSLCHGLHQALIEGEGKLNVLVDTRYEIFDAHRVEDAIVAAEFYRFR